MGLRLRYPRRALQDIEDIQNYIVAENPAAAERVWLSILSAVEVLMEFPFIGNPEDAAAHEGSRRQDCLI
jgi:plasmid stabilization system protein ParE